MFWLIGRGKVKELIYIGSCVIVYEVKEIGFVEYVMVFCDFMLKVEELVVVIFVNGLIVVCQVKFVINKGLEIDFVIGLVIE